MVYMRLNPHICRIAVNYFVLGVEKYTDNQQEEALQLFTISYAVNEKLGEEPPHKDPPNPSNKVTSDYNGWHYHRP